MSCCAFGERALGGRRSGRKVHRKQSAHPGRGIGRAEKERVEMTGKVKEGEGERQEQREREKGRKREAKGGQ